MSAHRSAPSELPSPHPGACYAHGARAFARHAAPLLVLALALEVLDLGALRAFASAGVAGLAGLAFVVCVAAPLHWGLGFVCLHAARGETPHARHLFRVIDNYREAMAAQTLLWIGIGAGLALGVVPGVWLYCRTRFVPYLVIEEEMPAADAIAESLRLTRGRTSAILGITLGGVVLCALGIALAGVGLVPALLAWDLALGSLYHATVLPSRAWEPASRLARPALGF